MDGTDMGEDKQLLLNVLVLMWSCELPSADCMMVEKNVNLGYEAEHCVV